MKSEKKKNYKFNHLFHKVTSTREVCTPQPWEIIVKTMRIQSRRNRTKVRRLSEKMVKLCKGAGEITLKTEKMDAISIQK